jgi:hypothetical protein
MKRLYLTIGAVALLSQQQAQAQFKIIGTEFVSGLSRVITADPLNPSNVIIGGNTGTGGSQNTFIGNYTGTNNNGGIGNTFVGDNSGKSNTTGNYNAFLGHLSGNVNTSGTANTFMGYLAGSKNTTASHNSFFGQGAGAENTVGFFNTFLGQSAGNKNTDGDQNTYVGQWAGFNGTTGNNNAFLGKEAGYNNVTGSSNTALGGFADFTFNNLQYATAIGYNAKVSASNALVLGGTGSFAVKVGIGVTNPATSLHLEGAGNEEILANSTGSGAKSGLNVRNNAGYDLYATLYGTTATGTALNPVGSAPAVPYANLGMLTTRQAPLMIGVHSQQPANTQDEQNVHFVNTLLNAGSRFIWECMRINKTNGFVGIHTRTAASAGSSGAPQALFHVNLTNPGQTGLNTLINGIRFEGLPNATHPDVIVIDTNGNLAKRPYIPAPPAGGCDTCWFLTGNNLVSRPTSFLGTLDAYDLNFKTTSTHRARITADGHWDFGANTITTGSVSGAFGNGNNIGGSINAFATGKNNTITSSDYSTALGQSNSILSSSNSFAAGNVNVINTASGSGSVAIGTGNVLNSSEESVAAGEGNTINDGHGCFIGGGHNITYDHYNIAIGSRLTARGLDAHAYGHSIENNRARSIAMGFEDNRTVVVDKRGVAIQMTPASTLTYAPNRNLEVDAASGPGAPSNVALHNLPVAPAPLPIVVIDPTTGDLFRSATMLASVAPSPGTLSITDDQLVKKAAPITNALEMIDKINPGIYQLDNTKYPALQLSGGEHYGILAKDLAKVIPGSVKDIPAQEKGSATVETVKAVDYAELIPVLVQALKEQQEQIKAQQSKIEALLAAAGNKPAQMDIALADKDMAVLEQNVPNPCDQSTTIGFMLPSSVHSAEIRFTNLEGRMIKSETINMRGRGSIRIDLSALSAGTYTYSLLINGKTADTKKLVVSH